MSLVLHVRYNSATGVAMLLFSLSFFVATVCTRFAYLSPALLLCCQTCIQENVTSFAWTWMVSALLCYQGSTQLRNSEELNCAAFNAWNSKWLQECVFVFVAFSMLITFFKPALLTKFALKDEAGHDQVYELCKCSKKVISYPDIHLSSGAFLSDLQQIQRGFVDCVADQSEADFGALWSEKRISSKCV